VIFPRRCFLAGADESPVRPTDQQTAARAIGSLNYFYSSAKLILMRKISAAFKYARASARAAQQPSFALSSPLEPRGQFYALSGVGNKTFYIHTDK
jgi:hypothetical protein